MGYGIDFASFISLTTLSSSVLVFCFFLLIYKIIFSLLAKFRLTAFLFKSDYDERWFGQVIGSLLVVSLALAANSTVVYIIAVIVIATLITRMEFLLWVLTLIGNRVEIAETMLKAQTQEQAPAPNVDKAIELVQQLENQGKQLQQAQEEKQFHLLTEFFYDTYAHIFGSQIEMLRMIESLPEQKATRQIMETFHGSTTWKLTYPFGGYVGFMLTRQLLAYDTANDTYSLTDAGRAFLAFLINKGLNTFQKQPF